jgi:hypothetical protein
LCFRSQGWEISTFDFVCSILLVLLIIKNICFPSIKRIQGSTITLIGRMQVIFSDILADSTVFQFVSMLLHFSYFVLCLNGSYSLPLPFREMLTFQIGVMGLHPYGGIHKRQRHTLVVLDMIVKFDLI